MIAVGLAAAGRLYGFSNEASGACGTDCASCHTLKKEEAQAILAPIAPEIKVLKVEKSPVGGLWEIIFEITGKEAPQYKGQKFIAYIDYGKTHLIQGSIIDIKGKTDVTTQKLEKLNPQPPQKVVDISKIPLNDALVLGKPGAKYRVIVFTDPECPFCLKLHQEAKKVVEKRKDIAFYIKLFPLKMHPGAYDKAKTIVCTKSMELLEQAYENKPIAKPDCPAPAIDKNIKLAESLGITGTPTMILPNGQLLVGAWNADALIKTIEEAGKPANNKTEAE